MSNPRILVTGSRDWQDKDTLITAFRDWWVAAGQPEAPVLVSGSCPTGADAMAEELWSRLGFPIESHPADWDAFGPAAGPKRNREMVSLGADQCLAFIRNNSKGATGTQLLARACGIPTAVFRDDS